MSDIGSITAAPALGHRWWRAGSLWQRILGLGRRPARRLRLCESLPLGERRFVAVIEFEQARFLVGGTPASLVLLARLDNAVLRPLERNEISPPGFCERAISKEGC